MNRHQSLVADSFIYAVLFLFVIACLLPFIVVLSTSLSISGESAGRFVLVPEHFSFDAYKYIFSSNIVPRALFNTIFITVAGTLINITFTSLLAYSLSKKAIVWRNFWLFLILFTILFNGGLIPNYLLVQSLGMINTYWALLIPNAISAFNTLILINFFRALPEELEDSARIDGSHDLGILFRIVLPLSLPALATFSILYAVGHWNTFIAAILYINENRMMPIQVILQQMVILAYGGVGESTGEVDIDRIPSNAIQMATLTVSTLPILMVYPFFQRHFVKGVLMGSLKG